MNVRITGGIYRGRLLRSYKKSSLRPTSEKVRAAVFSILGVEAVQGARVLDLYAGTGALGIEAFSRAADRVDFVESNARQSRQIRDNLRDLLLSERGKVYHARAEKILPNLSGGYDLVCADPPYHMNVWNVLMRLLNRDGFVKDNGLVVAEYRHGIKLTHEYGNLVRVNIKRYGDTEVSVYRLGINDG